MSGKGEHQRLQALDGAKMREAELASASATDCAVWF